MMLAGRCSCGAVSVTALLAVADLGAELEQLQRTNPAFHNVAEIEMLAQSRRRAPTDGALPQILADALGRMQEVMTRRSYLIRPRQAPPSGST